ncbi:hypothetical protein WK72_12090 [Burkholderia ubonensis]|nr:hypothetical protein WK72_12090 [Burkholderia ubonensis]KWB72750.1 hypothetical protein WL41_19020 [Burkholderia ubonensis]KWH12525.1 hypothetical protein WL97_18690 [Burkholderia ubonensis]
MGRGFLLINGIRSSLPASQTIQTTGKRYGTEAPRQIMFSELQVFANLKFRKRVHIGAKRCIFFNKPNFISAQQILIEQNRVVRRHYNLMPIFFLRFKKFFYKIPNQYWMKTAINLINEIYIFLLADRRDGWQKI